MQAAPLAATILEVARRAGVSASTVSRVFNGSAGVSERKRLAVQAAIQALNFRPNPSARSLKTGTTMSIGVVAQDLESPFFTRTRQATSPRHTCCHWATGASPSSRGLTAMPTHGTVMTAICAPTATTASSRTQRWWPAAISRRRAACRR
jgi:Bacterial regulatory proteins, lacI family